jgi:hypothetical protein
MHGSLQDVLAVCSVSGARCRLKSFASVISPIRARNKRTSVFGVTQGVLDSRRTWESASGTSAYNKAEPALHNQNSIAVSL